MNMKKRILAAVLLLFTLVSFVVPSYAASIDLTPELTGDASEILYEDTAKRDEYTRHYVTGDGSYVAVSYAEQVNYLDGDGEWVAVDNSFSENLTGTLENGNERFKLKFSNRADGSKLVSVKTDDYKVSWKLKFSYDGENYVAPEKSVAEGSGYTDAPIQTADVSRLGNSVGTVKYTDILPSVDLKYTVSHGKIKEDIILSENTGLSSYIAEYKVENGVTAVAADDGSVGFYYDGELLYFLASPYMYDAIGELCYGIAVEVKQEKKTVTVKYTLDTEWLSAPERVYPVVIDPTVNSSQGSSNIQSAFFNLNEYNSNGGIIANHYGQSPMLVAADGSVAYIEILNLPVLPAFSSIVGASLILHADPSTFNIAHYSATFMAQTVTESWGSNIGYTGFGIPACADDTVNTREDPESTPLRVEFPISPSNGNYKQYFNENHGFRLSASKLTAQLYASGNWGATILLRYDLDVDSGDTGIVSGKTYFLKNSASNKYLGVSDYLADNGEISANRNVFQKSAGVNDQYSRGVKINYYTTSSEYRLLSALSNYGINQYIYPDDSGNVTYGEGSSAASGSYWSIRAVDGGLVIYKLDNGIYKALTAVGSADGSETGTGSADNGNIILSEYVEGNTAQLWTVEQVNVNHHIINRSVTKKNIGAGEEWVFKLSASEMVGDKFTVGTPTVSREGVLKIHQSGKSLIVKVLPQDGTPDNKIDNFAIVTLPVTEKISENEFETEERVVVIQNSGTTNGGGCTTIPFEGDSTLRTITLNEGETAEYILTFKSSLGNVQIQNWDITNYDRMANEIDDGWGFRTVSSTEKTIPLCGSNFAVIKAGRNGISLVQATSTSGKTYTLIIEIRTRYDDGTYSEDRSFTLSLTPNTARLSRDMFYIFETSCSSINPISWKLCSDSDDNSKFAKIHYKDNRFCIVEYFCGNIQLRAFTTDEVIYYTDIVPKKNKAIIVVPGITGTQILASEDILINNVVIKEMPQGGYILNGAMRLLELCFGNGVDFSYTIPAGTSLFDGDLVTKLSGAYGINELEELVSRILALYYTEDGTSYFPTTINGGNKYGANNTYQKLILDLYADECIAKEYDVLFFKYDWRASCQNSAQALSAYIEQNGLDSVVLVAHSMGGLVASGYIAQGEEQQLKVEKLISLGTPYLGTPAAAEAFGSGDIFSVFGIKAQIAENIKQAIEIIDFFKIIIGNFQSMYELLPSEYYFITEFGTSYYMEQTDRYLGWESYTEQIHCDYDRSLLNLSIVNKYLNTTMIDNAELFHDSLYFNDTEGNLQHISCLVDSYYLYGSNLSTIERVTYSRVMTDGEIYKFWEDPFVSTCGDGMVVARSAFIKNNEGGAVYMGAIGHLDFPGNTEVIKYLIDLLTD